MNSARETDNSVSYKTPCRSTWQWQAEDCTLRSVTLYMAVIICHHGFAHSPKREKVFLEKSHACDLLSSLVLLLALLCCSFVKGQNILSKVECQYIGHCSNTKSKLHSLHWRACDQNSQDKAWKHREYLKSKVISFPFVLSKCSFSLATQIFPTHLS